MPARLTRNTELEKVVRGLRDERVELRVKPKVKDNECQTEVGRCKLEPSLKALGLKL